MNQLQSKINVRSEDFKTNQQAMQTLVTDLKQVAQRIALGMVKMPVKNIWLEANFYPVNVLTN